MALHRLTDAEILAQLPAARQRASDARRREPHGRAVRYARSRRQLVITLINDVELRIPIARLPVLKGATEAQLARVELSPAGFGVAWDELNVDFTVAQLAMIAVGPATVVRAATSLAGATRSPAKAAAARRNGLKGGRPRTTP
ncbi:MAG: DUF2442 domain-containing protein [Gemmatimonadales bacterium]|nr:DUF2442 domain-containing protein [Gemmatimonadales bacterium]MDZ4388623.1 DUF2442 domain-containing protein [Gemmatimonadales bacterium]